MPRCFIAFRKSSPYGSKPVTLLEAVRRTVAELRADIPIAFAETMEESFRADLLHATAVDPTEFARRGAGERAREWVAYRLRKWL